MYQVYSQQRPGRPQWALTASASLLLITVGMAMVVIKVKARALDVPLGEAVTYSEGAVTVCLPENWDILRSSEASPGVIVGAIEPDRKQRPGRRVFVFRGEPSRGAASAQDAFRALRQVARSLSQGSVHSLSQPTAPGRVGWLPGWTLGMTLQSHSIQGTALSIDKRIYVGRVATAPSGQTIGVILELAPSTPCRTADERLLDKICSHVSLLDVARAEDPDALMASAGITFDPPAGLNAHFLAEPDASLARLRLFGGEGSTYWHLTAYRIPLIRSITLQQLLRDHGLSQLQKTELPNPPEASVVNGREVVRLTLPVFPEKEPPGRLCAVQIDSQTGLFMTGRAALGADETLAELIRLIAGSATVANYNELIDIDQAQQTARKRLDQLRSKGLAAAWAPLEGNKQYYVLQAPGLVLGRETKVHHRHRQETKTWWTMEVVAELERSSGSTYRYHEQWRIRDDGLAHAFEMETFLNRRPIIRYTERSQGPADKIVRQLTVIDREQKPPATTTDLSAPIDDTYACEPVIDRIAAQLARDPAQAPAIFSTTETFTEQMSTWILVPLGKTRLPGPGADKFARAVRLQRISNPSPILFYYARGDTFLASSFDDGRWLERVSGEDDTRFGQPSAPRFR